MYVCVYIYRKNSIQYGKFCITCASVCKLQQPRKVPFLLASKIILLSYYSSVVLRNISRLFSGTVKKGAVGLFFIIIYIFCTFSLGVATKQVCANTRRLFLQSVHSAVKLYLLYVCVCVFTDAFI